MQVKSIALVALVAAVSAGCKCSPDPSTKATPEKAAASQKSTPNKQGASKGRGRREVDQGTTYRVAHGTSTAAYTVHLPDKVTPDAALPALIMLLDRGETAARFADDYNVVRGAKKLGYALALVSPPGGKRSHWGHGLCKGDAASAPATSAPSAGKATPAPASAAPPVGSAQPVRGTTNDDLALLKAIITDLGQKQKLDPAKITIIGTGEGALMAHQIAALAPEISSAVLVAPRAECTTPSAPVAPKEGRSVMVVAGPPSGAADAGAALPSLDQLVVKAWTSADKCDTAHPTTDKDKQLTITTQSCADGRVVRVFEDAKARRGWPTRLGPVYTMRAIHNFLNRQ